MATQVLQSQAVPESKLSAARSQPMNVLEEVEAADRILRERLQGALISPPHGVNIDDLPTVPLIDLRGALSDDLQAKRAVAAQIRDACITTGFFQITNHGIDEEAILGILKQAKRFFHDLSPEQKDKIHCRHSALFLGYESPGFSYVNKEDLKAAEGENANEPETKEAFNWGYEEALDPTGGDGKYVELDGTPPGPSHGNYWPSEDELPGFHAAVRDYYSQTMTLCRRLFGLFALSLGLSEDYFDDAMTHPGGLSRLIHYPAQPSSAMEGKDAKLGLGAHTDIECFTVLLADQNPGLEILFPPTPQTHDQPIWRPCPVRDNSITINIADFFQRWTNGLYKSTIHRVISKAGSQERYSVPTFFSINYDADVEPLPEDLVGKTKFQPLKAGEYILERLRATRKQDEEGEEKSNGVKV